MIYLYNKKNEETFLIFNALVRSFTKSQVTLFSNKFEIQLDKIKILVISSFDDNIIEIIDIIKNNKIKVLIFGKLNKNIINILKLEGVEIIDENFHYDHKIKKAKKNQPSESNLFIKYKRSKILDVEEFLTRPLVRYDFEDEWNNHNYGEIRTTQDFWSISQNVIIRDNLELAYIYDTAINKKICSFIAFWENKNQILWVNREASLIDSHEWRIIECFICNIGGKNFNALPLINEVPFGFDSCSTMRLDCDEDIKSSKNLDLFYNSKKIPLSFALVGSKLDLKNLNFLKNLKSPKHFLSHSFLHKEHWGGSEETCAEELCKNHELIKEEFGIELKFAVSPFHQSPSFLFKVLEQNKYKGFISGIINCYPEMMISRGGIIDQKNNLISHSQQCMLHGDCIAGNQTELIDNYKHSAKLSTYSRSIFGYLDHPFSDRYQYGWSSEKFRILCHSYLIDFLKKKRNLFLSEEDALNFIYNKNNISIVKTKGKFLINKNSYEPLSYKVEYLKKEFELSKSLIIND